MKDAIIICRTTEDTIVGGYTPLAFNNNDGYHGIYDPDGVSFTFCLTDNFKYQIKDNLYLLRRDNERISFSYHLKIVDKAHINQKSHYFFGEKTCQFTAR